MPKLTTWIGLGDLLEEAQDLGAAVTADALGTTTAGAVAQLPAQPSRAYR
jgi:hypothetical protein